MKKLDIQINFIDILGINKIPPFLKDGLIISFILHIFFLILIMVSPYIRIHSFIPQVKYDEPIIVNLDDLVVGNETILPPVVSKKAENNTEKEKFFTSEVKKEELPQPAPETEKTLQKEVSDKKKDNAGDFIDGTKQKTEEKLTDKKKKQQDLLSERMGGLNDLLASVDGLKRNEKNVKEKQKEDLEKVNTTQIKKGIEAESVDLGENGYVSKSTSSDFIKKQMAISYIDAIRIKLRSCWNLDPGAKDVKNMKIVIRTSISPDGNVNSIEILNKDEYATSPWFKAVADSAKRALIVCSPYNLPIEFYKDWKDIVFTFYPDKKSVQ